MFQACRTDLAQPAIPFSSGGIFQIAVTPKDHFNGGNPGVNEATAIDPQTGRPATVRLINLHQHGGVGGTREGGSLGTKFL
jgi:hypothetical protein